MKRPNWKERVRREALRAIERGEMVPAALKILEGLESISRPEVKA